MDWSFQLYSARKFPPWEDVLKTLADAGYTQVEGFAGVYEDAAGFRRLLDANGLTMPSGHFSLDALENDLDATLETASTLGIELVACPYIDAPERPFDAAGWTEFGKRLGRIGENVRAAGFGFAWHNHDFEFATLPDGSVPQALMLDAAPDLGWEFDVAWALRAGVDPLGWIDRYGQRIMAVHVKDIARSGEGLDEDGWSDVGYGTVDWGGLLKSLREKSSARYFVMEQDNPNDFDRFARRSIQSANSLL
ncbi:MAG: xylose isomerase [Mesorhizobium amorphae]|nr:MAG: xylose isomerase [Mesorhizobium amorphae]